MSQVLISVAPNGARKTASDHPALPVTSDEIAAAAKACVDAGAGLIHMHVRDDQGRHSLDPARYRDATDAVRAAVGDRLIIQITTESVGVYELDDQIHAVESVRPEAASVALREACPTDSAIDIDRYSCFLRDCRREKVWLQHILYDIADIQRFNRLRSEGVFGERAYVLLVVGRYAGNGEGDPLALAQMTIALHDSTLPAPDWAACGFGRAETRILTAAAALGGHIRVGFENNFLHANGDVAASNADRISVMGEALTAIGLTPMDAAIARRTLVALS